MRVLLALAAAFGPEEGAVLLRNLPHVLRLRQGVFARLAPSAGPCADVDAKVRVGQGWHPG